MPRQRKGGDIWGDILKSVAPVAIDIGSQALKNYATGGKVRLKKRGGDLKDILTQSAKIGMNPTKYVENMIKEQAPAVQQAISGAMPSGLADLFKRLTTVGLPLNISSAQARSLVKGGAITLKKEHIAAGKHILNMTAQLAKKFLMALMKGKGQRVAPTNIHHIDMPLAHPVVGLPVNPRPVYNPIEHRDLTNDEMEAIAPFPIGRKNKDINGGDIWGDILKSVAPVAIDIGSQALKNYATGGKIRKPRKPRAKRGGDIWGDIARSVAPVAIDIGAQALKNYAGSGMKSHKKRVMRGGSAYVSLPYKTAMSDIRRGGDIWGDILKSVAPVAIDVGSQALKNYIGSGFMPAGTGIYPAGSYGSGIYPAGSYGSGMIDTDLDRPIQLGSPYQHINSPAMRPFIAGHSQLSGYNPLPKVIG